MQNRDITGKHINRKQEHELPAVTMENIPSLSISFQSLSGWISFVYCLPQPQDLQSWKIFLPSSFMATSYMGILEELLSGSSRGLTVHFLWVCARVFEDCFPRLNSEKPSTATNIFISHGLQALIFPPPWTSG